MNSGPLIAIFCNSFPPEGGGASGRIYNLVVLLRNAGYRVQVVSAMPNYPTGKIFPAYRGKIVFDEDVDGISVRRVWLSPSNSASAMSRSWSMLSFVLSLKLLAFPKIRKMNPALVIVSSPPLPMAAAAVRYFKKHNTRVLLNVSDIWPLSANALGAMKRSRLYQQLELVSKRMYEGADAITAQSTATLAHIRQHCSTMPPAMLYRNLPAASMALQDYPARPDGKLKIVYPGVLGHAQGLLALCRTIDFNVLNAELHIYGEGIELEPIRVLVAANPQCGVVLHKPVSAKALPAILHDAAAVLIPLIAPIEGALPSKLFTAIQSGCPVLYSGGGEGASIAAGHGLGWIATPGDYDAIAGHIRELSAMSAEEVLKMRKHIREVATRHFDKEEQDNRFLLFISGIIHGH